MSEKTIVWKGKKYHILQPGERHLGGGKWCYGNGKPGRGRCVDAQRAAVWASKGKRHASKKSGLERDSGAKKGKKTR